MTDIDSPKNPRVAAVHRLHRRRNRRIDGRTILEGPHLLEAALDAGVEVEEVFTLSPDGPIERRAAESGSRVTSVAERVLARLSDTESPRGPVSVIPVPPSAPVAAMDSIVLAGVADPGNAGTIIRSAAALRFQVIVAGGGVDVWGPKALRAGAGGQFAVRIAQTPADPTSALRDAGVACAALVVRGGTGVDTLGPEPVALLVGSEPHGLPRAIVDACEHRITLSMPGGIESLNASVAASIAMWERARARG